MLSTLNVAIGELVFAVCLRLLGGKSFQINTTLCEDKCCTAHVFLYWSLHGGEGDVLGICFPLVRWNDFENGELTIHCYFYY